MRYIFPLIITAFTLPNLVIAECTRDQAFNKMMKLNQLNMDIQSQVPADPRKHPRAMSEAHAKMVMFTTEMAPAGPLLADGKYNEACAIYDKVAAKFGFNLNAAKSLTMEQLEKDGGKSVGGKCDVTEMAIRNAKLMEDFSKAYDAGKFTYERQREFSKDSENLGRFGSSDPGKACDEIARLRDKYQL